MLTMKQFKELIAEIPDDFVPFVKVLGDENDFWCVSIERPDFTSWSDTKSFSITVAGPERWEEDYGT